MADTTYEIFPSTGFTVTHFLVSADIKKSLDFYSRILGGKVVMDGENAIVIPSDATSLPDMDALAAKVKETFGKLDVLFVNAGYGRFIPFEAVLSLIHI